MAITVIKTIPWRELKEGDVFRIVSKPAQLVDGGNELYEIKGKYIIHFGGYGVRRFVTFPGYSPDNDRRIQDIVEVIEPTSLAATQQLINYSGRVNSATGADPEIFVTHGTVKENLLPAFRFLQKKPENVQLPCANGGAVAYRDGFAAEYAVPPGGCHGYLINDLRDGLKKVLAAARVFDRTAKLSIKNTFTIPRVTMNSASDEDVALGCLPSLNAYDDVPEQPSNARDLRMRFAGGHVHLGLGSIPKARAVDLVKGCDLIAGVPAVALFASLDTPIRRQFYGRAGEFRIPAHGVEYRVLSNGWLAAPEVAHLVLNLVRCGAKVGFNKLHKLFNLSEDKVREIINFCDVKSARKFVIENASSFDVLLQKDGVPNGTVASKAFKDAIEGGIEAVIPDFQDVERNWLLAQGQTWIGESNGMKATWGHLCMHRKAKA